MATKIDPLRFDRRRTRLARELVDSFDADERRALEAVWRADMVSGRWEGHQATALVVHLGEEHRAHVATARPDLAAAVTRMYAAGWLRWSESAAKNGWGVFHPTVACEDICCAAGINAELRGTNTPSKDDDR